MAKVKECSICREVKGIECFYSYQRKNSLIEKNIGYFSYCKDCAIEKSEKWNAENPEKRRRQIKDYHSKPETKIKNKEINRKYRERGDYREWQRNNKDKLDKYSQYRAENKYHEITKKEWEKCKGYFNDSCAYCGMTNDEAKRVYKNYLHKDHADHEGANDLSNCVPACKSCNSSKHVFILSVWYDEKNINFEESRLEKIYSWLNKDFYECLDSTNET